MKRQLIGLVLVLCGMQSFAQEKEQNQKTELPKAYHAEPLYLDLVRDLGARKGEKEWNLGAGFSRNKNYAKQSYLVEYEFAPVDRLGVEVEADFSFYNKRSEHNSTPNNRLDGLRLATQYSFFVSPKALTTLAIGYAHIFEFSPFQHFDSQPMVEGMLYSPFFIAAKRWGNQFHSLAYISPVMKHNFEEKNLDLNWQFNLALHYVIPNTKHFVGVELFEEVHSGKSELTIRPQAKYKINHHFAAGVVAGIPTYKNHEGYSGFVRIIYEP